MEKLSFEKYCPYCLASITRGKHICDACEDRNVDASNLERQLVESFRSKENWEFIFRTATKEILEANELEMEIRQKIVNLKKKRSGHLHEVNKRFLSSEKLRKTLLKNASEKSSQESFEKKQMRIDHYRKLFVRKAKLEVTFDKESAKYKANIFKEGSLFHSIEAPKWKRDKIRYCLDQDSRPSFPWKLIEHGHMWETEIFLSPYLLEEIIVPNNVVKLSKF